MRFIDHHHLKRSGPAEDAVGARGILNPRQLHDDPAIPLPLNHGLCHTELVDPVTQSRHILFKCELKQLVNFRFRQVGAEDVI